VCWQFFFIPILLLAGTSYSWMDIPPGHEATLDSKRAYAQFIGSSFARLIFFSSGSLRPYSCGVFRAQDKDGNPLFTFWMRVCRSWQPAGCLPFVSRLAAVDWI